MPSTTKDYQHEVISAPGLFLEYIEPSGPDGSEFRVGWAEDLGTCWEVHLKSGTDPASIEHTVSRRRAERIIREFLSEVI